MYRVAPVRAQCTGCGAEVPLRWAELDPAGRGVRCFRCVLARQVDEHQRVSTHKRNARDAVRWTVAGLGIAVAAVIAFGIVLAGCFPR
jgi:hypothetical protein